MISVLCSPSWRSCRANWEHWLQGCPEGPASNPSFICSASLVFFIFGEEGQIKQLYIQVNWYSSVKCKKLQFCALTLKESCSISTWNDPYNMLSQQNTAVISLTQTVWKGYKVRLYWYHKYLKLLAVLQNIFVKTSPVYEKCMCFYTPSSKYIELFIGRVPIFRI